MRYSGEHIDDAVFLLKELVKIPSYTFQEEAIADFLEKYLTEAEEKYACNYKIRRIKNNLLLYGDDYSQKKETLLFCAHIDTVKESGEYTFAPFCGTVTEGRVLGLGSNDDKGSVTAAIFAFLYYIRYCNKKNINVILALCAEEERGGENGISPLVLDYTVDTAALSECGVEGSAVLKVNISVSRSAAEDVAAEDVYNALSSAVCTASYSSGDSSTALSAQSHVSGGGADAVLVLSVPFSPPVGGECGIRLSVAFASSPLFERERSGLFTLSSVIVAA